MLHSLRAYFDTHNINLETRKRFYRRTDYRINIIIKLEANIPMHDRSCKPLLQHYGAFVTLYAHPATRYAQSSIKCPLCDFIIKYETVKLVINPLHPAA